MRTAVGKSIRDVTVLLAIGATYYFINRFTGFGIPCAFREVTGFPCPSCGITHMFIHLASFDFQSAFYDNQFIFITWPFLMISVIYSIYEIEANRDFSRINLIFLCVYATALLIFGVFRIIYSF